MTSENSPETDLFGMALPSTRSAAASRAKTSPLPDWALASMAHALASGANTPESFARFDPATSSWKTYQRSFLADWEEFSATWPRSGTMRSGTAFLLPPLARRIYGTGFGSSPTHSIPTPTAQDHIERKSTSTETLNYETNKSVSLDRFARMWPTPRANMSTGAGSGPNLQGGPNLQTAVLWPTPTGRDWKDGASIGSAPVNGLLGRIDDPSPSAGSLNPTWVEALMGFPHGWTDTSEED